VGFFASENRRRANANRTLTGGAFSNDQQDRGTRGDMANRQIDWQE